MPAMVFTALDLFLLYGRLALVQYQRRAFLCYEYQLVLELRLFLILAQREHYKGKLLYLVPKSRLCSAFLNAPRSYEVRDCYIQE